MEYKEATEPQKQGDLKAVTYEKKREYIKNLGEMRPEDGARKGTVCGRFTLNSKNELIETALGRAPPPKKAPTPTPFPFFFLSSAVLLAETPLVGALERCSRVSGTRGGGGKPRSPRSRNW